MQDKPLLFGEDGKAVSLEGAMISPNALNVASVYNNVANVYPHTWDEAMRDAPVNALAMQRDSFYRSLIQERTAPTINLEWEVKADKEDDPIQQLDAEVMNRAWREMPDKVGLMDWLLRGAVWFGRSGSQGVWGDSNSGLKNWVAHEPIHGDSIQYQWDNTPVLMVSQFSAQRYQRIDPDAVVSATTRGAYGLRLYKPEYRNRFIIHTHVREAADYYEGEMSGGVHGVGLRSWAYWSDYIRRDTLEAMTSFMRSSGMMDLIVFNFPHGDAQAQARAEANAKKVSGKIALVCPRDPNGNWPAIEQFPMNSAGIEVARSLVEEYFDRNIRELFVGQNMSNGGGGPGGLEGDGRAELAGDTKFQLCKSDALRVAETLTRDWLTPCLKYNRPGSNSVLRMVPKLEDPKADKKVQNASILINAGVEIEEDELREAAGFRTPRPGKKTVGGKPEQQAAAGNAVAATGDAGDTGDDLGGSDATLEDLYEQQEAIVAYRMGEDPNYKNPEWHAHNGKWRRWTGSDYDYSDTQPTQGGAANTEQKPKGRFGRAKEKAAERLKQTKGGRAILAMGKVGSKIFHAVEHRLLYAAKKTQEIAVQAARENGLPEEKVPALKKSLYVADFLGGYATGAAALVVAGPVAGKVAAIMPSASVAYLAYSTAKNPLATWRAAKKVVADTFRKRKEGEETTTHSLLIYSADMDGVRVLANQLCDRFAELEGDEVEWYVALFHAALANAEGDVSTALELADEAFESGEETQTNYDAMETAPGVYPPNANRKTWKVVPGDGGSPWYSKEKPTSEKQPASTGKSPVSPDAESGRTTKTVDENSKKVERKTANESKAAKRKKPKAVKRFKKDLARSRRIKAAWKVEKEVADGIDGYNLPDSEPADVIWQVDLAGNPIKPGDARSWMRKRREAVHKIAEIESKPETERTEWENTYIERASAGLMAEFATMIEVKTLQKSSKNSISMSKNALVRKERYKRKYQTEFSTIIVDMRKGKKYSGHRMYLAPLEIGKTIKLADCKKIESAKEAIEIIKEHSSFADMVRIGREKLGVKLEGKK